MNNTSPATQATHTQPDDELFPGIKDESPSQSVDVRNHYLNRARKGYAELHRDWIQKPNTEASRASLLADFVRNRRENALEAMLMLHSLEPVLRNNNWLPMSTWAALLTKDPTRPMTPNAASKAFATLEDMHLVKRQRIGHRTVIEPLAEDGSGDPWQRTGAREDKGKGYFTLPFDYWTQGYSSELTLPAKAVFLILLSETHQKSNVTIAIDRFPEWYGISERSAERGYRQLETAGVLATLPQKVSNPEVRGGWHYVYHRALKAPFSTSNRQSLQRAAFAEGTARRAKGKAPKEVIEGDDDYTTPLES